MNINATTNIHYTITYNIDKEQLLKLRELLNSVNQIAEYIEFENDKATLVKLIRLIEQLTDFNV